MINDTVIDQKPEITFLGVTLDDQLSFSSHVSNVCRKASSQTGVLLRLRSLIPTSAKLHIVKFAVLPHLTYCQTVWHFCRSSDAGAREEGGKDGNASFLLSLLARPGFRVPLAPKTPFPFPFKRLPRRLGEYDTR